ncbi:MAG: amylo-alpha-1,6-glucosidase [Gemmatimonadales bacterium]
MVRRVGFVGAGAEGDAGFEWLVNLEGVLATRYDRLSQVTLAESDLIWAHGPVESAPALRPWLDGGGRLLATLDAVELPAALGIEPTPPNESREAVWRHAEDEFWLEEFRSFKAFPHIRGLAAFGPHPLFVGIDQGTYTWAPSEGEAYRWLAYHGIRPAAGAVVAVERSFIHLNPGRAVCWEYGVGDGGVLCIGAFVALAAPDTLLARQLRSVLANAIVGDGIPHRDRAVPVAVWPEPGGFVRREAHVPVPDFPGMEGEWPEEDSPLAIHSPAAGDDPWTHAGRRMVLAGGERSGLREVWCHPFRLMREVRVEPAGGLEPAGFTAAPERMARVLRGEAGECREWWSAALELPAFLWDLRAPAGRGLVLRWAMDLRRMWPYPAGAFGDLRWNLSEDRTRLWVGASGAAAQAAFAVVGGRFDVPGPVPDAGRPMLAVRVEGQGAVRVVAVGACDSDELDKTLRALERKRFEGFRNQRQQHAGLLHRYGASLETPVPALDLAFEWAKVRCDGFVAQSPGVGRSLLAGYAASTPGWGDGRPGYAWFFGRDACWTAFAQLAAGDREGPRDVLKFLSQSQDVTGKVLHEYTTSGLVHYDAADSTPLYLLLAARFAAWTGDLEYLERYWPAVERAYRFCLSTDRDGDGLIENTRVGHGWIEHGPLGGARVTLYLAACWLAALEGLEPVVDALGRADLAEELRERAGAARAAIHRRFLVEGEWALGLLPDGSPQLHRTAMLAVPLLLGAVDPDDAASWYREIAGEGFSAPWGVRMLATDDPLFQPTGYHRGAVWPLYTGWVSLAEWRGGHCAAALGHLLANAALAGERAKGAFDEVLHGLERRDAGVCPDQAWSAAMVLSPAIEGLWGIVPDALSSATRVAPWLPPDWPRMALHRLRVGRSVVDLEMRRRPGQIVARIRKRFGPSIHLTLDLSRNARPAQTLVDGIEVGGPVVRFLADGEHEVIVLRTED